MAATHRQRLAIDHRRQVRHAEQAARIHEWQSAAIFWSIAADYAKMLSRSFWMDGLLPERERMNKSHEWDGIASYDKSKQADCADLAATEEGKESA